MIQFTKPKNLNGTELLKELNAVGVKVTQSPMIDGDGNFWLELAETDKAKATEIITNHNGTTIPAEPTVADKLASVGLSVAELKTALGL